MKIKGLEHYFLYTSSGTDFVTISKEMYKIHVINNSILISVKKKERSNFSYEGMYGKELLVLRFL
jgi:hypothetical protein